MNKPPKIDPRIEREYCFQSADILLAERKKGVVDARKHAIGMLDAPARKSRRFEYELRAAFRAYAVQAVREERAPPSIIRNHLREVAKCARKLDGLLTGGRGTEPLPGIRDGLTAPARLETGVESAAGFSADGSGVLWAENSPVIQAIENVQAVARWAEASESRIARQVKPTPGGRYGNARAHLLNSLEAIWRNAHKKAPLLTADPTGNPLLTDDAPEQPAELRKDLEGQAVGPFADFMDAAIEALNRSFTQEFYEAAPKAQQKMEKLGNDRRTLYTALQDNIASRKLESPKPRGRRKSDLGEVEDGGLS